jgi:hypothetical protein
MTELHISIFVIDIVVAVFLPAALFADKPPLGQVPRVDFHLAEAAHFFIP